MQSWCISEMSSFSHYLADFMYRFFCQALTLSIHSSCPHVGDTETFSSSLQPSSSTPIWALWSALSLLPSAAGLRVKERPAELRSMPGAREAGRSRSFCLPDHVQDLHHLLVDDEYYGHIQAHSAQPGNCPFIETTGERKEEKQVSMKILVTRRSHVCRN